MKLKTKHLTWNRYTVSVLVLAVVTATSAAVMLRNNRTDAAPAVKPAVRAAVPSQFSFSGASGWFQGATSKTGMALFHKYDCFVSVQHKSGSIDADKARIQANNAKLANDGYTVTPSGTQTLAVQTATGPQQYEVDQATVTTPAGGDKIEGGQEYGWLQLDSGYLYVEGHCDTANQLASTIPALQAVKFDESKQP